MEERKKIDQQTDRPNRDQETEKRPTQGSSDVNRPQQGQRDQQDRDKKTA